MEDITERIKLAGQTNKLCLTQEGLKDYHLVQIGKSYNLTILDLYDCVNLHNKLNFLSNLVHLHKLELAFSKLTDDDLIYLKPLQNLVYLNLAQNPLSGKGFADMQFNNLKTLDMMRTDMNMDGIVAVTKCFPNLETFIYYNGDDEFNEDCLKYLCEGCKHLKDIDLSDVDIVDYSSLALCPNLESASIYYTEHPSNYISSSDIRPKINEKYSNMSLPILPNIKSLTLCRELSEKIMKQIHLYLSLEELCIRSLNNNFIHPNIILLKNLKKLNIHAYLQNDDLEFLRYMPQLEELDVRFNYNLDNNTLSFFRNLANLKSLNVYKTKITPACLNEYKKYFSDNCQIYPD
jgi:hypothetical protein